MADALFPLVDGFDLALRDAGSGFSLVAAGASEAMIAADMIGAAFNEQREWGRKLVHGRADDIPARLARAITTPRGIFRWGCKRRSEQGRGAGRAISICPPRLGQGVARALAEARLHSLWTGRRTLELRCDWRALTLQPCAVVSIEGETGRWRIERSEWEGMGGRLGLRRVGGAGVVAPPASGGSPVSETDILHGPTSLIVADLPMPGDALFFAPVLVAAAAGTQTGWRSAELFVEDAATGGRDFFIGGTAPPAIMGMATGALGGAASPALFDLTST